MNGITKYLTLEGNHGEHYNNVQTTVNTITMYLHLRGTTVNTITM